MTKRQKNGRVGYNNAIKRNLLNAYRVDALTIWTKRVRVPNLDRQEKRLIKHYGLTNRLWNRIHNETYFSLENYSF